MKPVPFCDSSISRKKQRLRCFFREIEESQNGTGVTLLELLIVLGFMATLMGIGIGIYGRLNLGNVAAPGLVKGVLRSARTHAIAESSFSRVDLDHKDHSIRSVALKTIGLWHFEDDSSQGAFGLNASLNGAQISSAGKIGSCIRFSKASEQWIELPVGGLSSYATREGIGLECDLFLERDSAGKLFERAQNFSLSLIGNGALGAEVTVKDENGERKASAQTKAGTLQLGRWHHLSFLYDCRRIRIFIDGLEVASVAESGKMESGIEETIFISDRKRGFEGKIDELRISALRPSEIIALPKGVEFAPGVGEIYFNAAGNLDPLFHAGPEKIGLVYETGKVVELELSSYGTLR